jgi:hypothetical protein
MTSEAVFVSIYDLTWYNAALAPFGMGLHHSGVEVYGEEFWFGREFSGTGVVSTPPMSCYPHLFRVRILLGTTSLPKEALMALIATISKDWSGLSYHLTRRNCNNFARYLADAIVSDWIRPFPAYLGRIERVGLAILPKSAIDFLEVLDRQNAAQALGVVDPQTAMVQ